MKEVYLGDGLYASFDGYQIILRAPRGDENHFVALEPQVYSELACYAKTIWDTHEPEDPEVPE